MKINIKFIHISDGTKILLKKKFRVFIIKCIFHKTFEAENKIFHPNKTNFAIKMPFFDKLLIHIVSGSDDKSSPRNYRCRSCRSLKAKRNTFVNGKILFT